MPEVPDVKGNLMVKPEWIVPAAVGALAGALRTAAGGGGWAGRELRSGVRRAVEAEPVRALVPICVDQARTDPERQARLQVRLAALRPKTPLAQFEIMFETGSLPGALAEAGGRAVTKGCLAALRNRGV
ncbi:hypothetical protein AP071_07440 [Rhodobacter capsulatus]|nr:hypothetical protein AP071_07440 [Rhodobacter capsulatus]KQB12706.1 hypothetical protein AP073_06285 [Rhodobacter capsulatus]